jgi:hypothetical protein
MLVIKIDDPEIENRLRKYAKQQKKAIEDLVNDAMKLFLETHQKDDTLIFTKKDPMQYIHKIEYEYDDDLCDNVALTHIEDSAKYIHDLRRQKRYE